ncbi:hypothetical protein C5E10_06300 [Pseudoclavibacter sp. RFBG4]|uniref:hypothetical protein n=1 Tax=Pseudoclavibacter sp. RFBG4 TaxID=2080575 RepID=UPI000CE8409F|nr:hypothetical protein [Pseudoclavibacter sp. RFBG4]PPG35199.1 hypothetical protein C5E10_06300 [Pseudoclavibacter sp. RFBG4]
MGGARVNPGDVKWANMSTGTFYVSVPRPGPRLTPFELALRRKREREAARLEASRYVRIPGVRRRAK